MGRLFPFDSIYTASKPIITKYPPTAHLEHLRRFELDDARVDALRERRDHGSPGGHVDPSRQRLRGEHDLLSRR